MTRTLHANGVKPVAIGCAPGLGLLVYAAAALVLLAVAGPVVVWMLWKEIRR